MSYSLKISANERNELYKFSIIHHGENSVNKTAEYTLMTGGNYHCSKYESNYFGEVSYGVVDVKSKPIEKLSALAQINKILGNELTDISIRSNFKDSSYSRADGNIEKGIGLVLRFLSQNISLKPLIEQQPNTKIDNGVIKIGNPISNSINCN